MTEGHLQDEGGQTEDTSEAGAREGDSLAGTGSRQGSSLGRGGDNDGGGGLGDADGRVAGGRVGGHRLGDGARAVGDGQGRGLSDGDGLAVVDEGRRVRAVRGQGGHDLGGVADVPCTGLDGSGGGEEGGDGELHFD